MPVVWVLAVLVLLLTLLLCMRLRVRLSAKDGALNVYAAAGFVRFRVYPPKERKKAASKPEPKAEQKKEKPKQSDAGKLIQTVRRVWEPAMETLRRVRRGVRLNPMRLSVTYGGRDEPADAAVLCGDTLAFVWAVMPTLERVLRVHDPRITVNVDFDAPDLRVEADIGLTIRVWAVLVSLVPLLPLLRGGIYGKDGNHGKE